MAIKIHCGGTKSVDRIASTDVFGSRQAFSKAFCMKESRVWIFAIVDTPMRTTMFKAPLNKVLRILATVALSLDLQASRAASQRPPHSVADHVVRVHASNFHGSAATGSGVTIAPGKVLTACHVTKDAVHIQILFEDKSLTASEQQRDVHHDLCVLKVPGLTAAPAQIGPIQALREGSSIVAAGYSLDERVHRRGGIVQRLHRYDGSKLIQSSAAFDYGDSGGGVFDASGQLVGIMAFLLGREYPASFAVPAEWIGARIDDEASFVPIAPQSAGRPFFIDDFGSLPWFLRAAKYERDGRWADLTQLANDWIAVDPDNPDAWFARAVALAELGETGLALAAYRNVIAIAPDCSLAWLRLGLLYAGHGRLYDSEQALHALVNP